MVLYILYKFLKILNLKIKRMDTQDQLGLKPRSPFARGLTYQSEWW